jgi:hypothetical protein
LGQVEQPQLVSRPHPQVMEMVELLALLVLLEQVLLIVEFMHP